MIETMIAIILLPFAAVASLFTLAFGAALIETSVKALFKGGKHNG